MYKPDAQGILDLMLTTDFRVTRGDSPESFSIDVQEQAGSFTVKVKLLLDDSDELVIGIELAVEHLETVNADESAAAAIFHDLLDFNTGRLIGCVTFNAQTGQVGYFHSDALPLVGDEPEADLELLQMLITCFIKNITRMLGRIHLARQTGKTHLRREQQKMDDAIEDVFDRSWREFGAAPEQEES